MMTPEELRKQLDSLRAAFAEHEQIKQKRGWRNKVDPLSLEYEDYKKTKLWKQIKSRVLIRDDHLCRRCGAKADLVHHLSYDVEVMLGQLDSKLVSLCSGCHEIVHFSSTGMRRTSEEQLDALSDMALNEVIPKVDLRMSPFKRSVWKRLTAAQKSAYLSEYNKRKIKNKKLQ